MLSTGSIVTIESSGSLGILTVGDIRPQISAYIQESPLAVRAFDLQAESLLNAVIGGSLGYNYNSTIAIQTAVDFALADDVRKIFDNAVYRATGSLPAASRVTKIVTPTGATQQTIQTLTGVANTTVNTEGPLDKIAAVFGTAASTVRWILIGLAAIIVLTLVLIGYAPNVGAVVKGSR